MPLDHVPLIVPSVRVLSSQLKAFEGKDNFYERLVYNITVVFCRMRLLQR